MPASRHKEKIMSNQNMRVAIVTGGGSGIGLAIAEKYVENDIHTVIIGRDEAKLNKAKAALGDLC
jgi:NADP-dependent 3-hydroxy acid dehydrogenase YdfG